MYDRSLVGQEMEAMHPYSDMPCILALEATLTSKH